MKQTFSALMLFLVGSGLGSAACTRHEPKPMVRGAAPSMEAARQQMLEPALPPGHPAVDNPHANNPHADQMLPPPAGAGTGESIQWDLPKGWTETRTGGMRVATLKPPVTGKIDASVIMLPGTAGGELGNVNRWRGQVGLPAIDDGARTGLRKEVKSKAGAISLYDFTGEGAEKQRMLAGLLFVDGRSWFLKMTGDPDAVGAAKADFVKVLESLRMPADK
jgi:hypothetical protein